MKKVISEKTLHNIVRKHINEALNYNKPLKQYFPNYTGNPHSDAGKFVSNNRDNYNYARNDYKWSDPEKQSRFDSLRWKHDLEVSPFDPDEENQYGAEEYLQNREAYTIIEKATEEMSGEFVNMIQNFFKEASQRYPILKDKYNMLDFIGRMRDVFEELDIKS